MRKLAILLLVQGRTCGFLVLLALLLVLVDFVALVIHVVYAGCGKHGYLLYC